MATPTAIHVALSLARSIYPSPRSRPRCRGDVTIILYHLFGHAALAESGIVATMAAGLALGFARAGLLLRHKPL
jgi:hypothetical protein